MATLHNLYCQYFAGCSFLCKRLGNNPHVFGWHLTSKTHTHTHADADLNLNAVILSELLRQAETFHYHLRSSDNTSQVLCLDILQCMMQALLFHNNIRLNSKKKKQRMVRQFWVKKKKQPSLHNITLKELWKVSIYTDAQKEMRDLGLDLPLVVRVVFF